MVSVDALEHARTLARQLDPTCDLSAATLSLLAQSVTAAHRLELCRALQVDAQILLDTQPRYALGLARVTNALAQTQEDANLIASTAVTLAVALNQLGEFHAALAHAESATMAREAELAARAWCEIAWAHLFIGALGEGTTALTRARVCTAPLIQARCDWLAGLIARDRGDLANALTCFETARAAFHAASQSLNAARCERDAAFAHIRRDDEKGLTLLTQVRQIFATIGARLDAAHCDYFSAAWWLQHDAPTTAFDLLMTARQVFADERAEFFVALCDNDLGLAYRYLEQFDQAIGALHRACAYFRAHHIPKQISTTDINLGGVYYLLNQYDKALATYREAAELALGEGRVTRAARIWNNMAMVHVKQGRYDQAFDLYQRALHSIADQAQPFLAAGIHVSLAACYRDLGQETEALSHLHAAEEVYRFASSRTGAMSVAFALAEVYLGCGDLAQAARYAQRARRLAEKDQYPSLIALAERLLAQTITRQAEHPRALKWLAHARMVFRDQKKPMDVALCDLIEGELHLRWRATERARECFTRAREILVPHLPDYAWRVEQGLAHCALARGCPNEASVHFQNAVRLIADVRALPGAEQFSNDFLARRISVYDDALALAVAQHDAQAALAVIEASKARAFLALLQRRGWQMPQTSDRYVMSLVTEERRLRDELERARAQVLTQTGDGLTHARGDTVELDPQVAKLDALGRAYEAVVAKLRLAQPGMAGVVSLAPWVLAEFRAAMTRAYGADWCALDYTLSDGRIVIVSVTPQQIQLHTRDLGTLDQRTLEQATMLTSDMRELIYRGTLRGASVPLPGKQCLQNLYRLLIPGNLNTKTLIVSPHGILHALPFHALREGETYLAEKCAVIYTPSFQVLQHLAHTPDNHTPHNVLVFGLGEFGRLLPALKQAEHEAKTVRALWPTGELRLGIAATRAEMLRLNATGALREFDLIHLATHAILDRTAPHQSRVLLADEPLTTFDVLGLTLKARLVTLSACQTALGKGGAGDEWIGLARAFFYAGAQALLATLWHVEDHSTSEMIVHVYEHLAHGETLARAVQLAQIEMIRAGRSPYQWAAFVLMGYG